MHEFVELKAGLQCCLLCGRMLTDRALHDRVEEPILASIRTAHPEWQGADESCQPCVHEYRKLLADRLTRAEKLAARARERRVPHWLSRLLGRNRVTGATRAIS